MHGNFFLIYAAVYTLSMASTALAVLLGSCVEDSSLASALLPILFVPQMLFAGFFVWPDLIPFWLRWVQYLCSLTYAVRILLIEEFANCGYTCDTLVHGIGANPDDTWWYWMALLALFAVFRLCALIVLRQKASIFY